jgi:integrase
MKLYDTRHTAASLMLASGVPVKVVADLLGHDPRVTLATYAQSSQGWGGRPGLRCWGRRLVDDGISHFPSQKA